MKLCVYFALILQTFATEEHLLELSDQNCDQNLNENLNENLNQNLDENSNENLATLDKCPICYDVLNWEMDDCLTKPPCGHYFHFDCLTKWMIETTDPVPTCPYCRMNLNFADLQKYDPDSKNFRFVSAQEKHEFELPQILADRRRANKLLWEIFKTVVTLLMILGAAVWPFVPLYFALMTTMGILRSYSHYFLLQFYSLSVVTLFWIFYKFFTDPNQLMERKKYLLYFTYIYLTVYFILLKTYFALNTLNGEGGNNLYE